MSIEQTEKLASTENQNQFIVTQITEAIETYRVQYNLLIQIATALITADVAVVGFAFSSTNAGILAIGSLFPLTLFMVYRGIGRRMIPIVYSAIMMEARYDIDNDYGLISSFIGFTISPSYVKQMKTIGDIPNSEEKIKRLCKMQLPISKSIKAELLILFVLASQVLFALITAYIFNWRVL